MRRLALWLMTLMLPLALAAPVAVLTASPGRAETLVVALSTEQIEVAANFTGGSISLFGVIERDAQTVARTGSYQVIVVVRGPSQDILVQQRVRRFGIWMNDDGERFAAMPSYYGLFSTDGARDLLASPDGVARELSLSRLGSNPGVREELRAAIIRQRQAAALFVERLSGVTMLTGTFFRTEIPLPSLVADGSYSVSVLLYAGDVALDTDTRRFSISKVGTEQRLFELSQTRPLVYGIGVVLLALVTGYAGGILFRR